MDVRLILMLLSAKKLTAADTVRPDRNRTYDIFEKCSSTELNVRVTIVQHTWLCGLDMRRSNVLLRSGLRRTFQRPEEGRVALMPESVPRWCGLRWFVACVSEFAVCWTRWAGSAQKP